MTTRENARGAVEEVGTGPATWRQTTSPSPLSSAPPRGLPPPPSSSSCRPPVRLVPTTEHGHDEQASKEQQNHRGARFPFSTTTRTTTSGLEGRKETGPTTEHGLREASKEQGRVMFST
ncbi:unnamed protein product, partial [Ectocarpus sp. 8 AP-2014]